ncbi:DUF362 domain-containing protein [Desulfovermiculus halophilus]|uniref:DUF362 domain-containing protein n=1 Tax=Desulfovermiculus halophilus TaxID=339722 RepID=UPI000481D4D8|nr:DUF362 domain-containing protein [Desulfovermiculus halophilus]
MSQPVVSITRYEQPEESLRLAVDRIQGWNILPANPRVFIKPNIVTWTSAGFPKWGVITTSRLVRDMVVLLQEYGVTDITIGEGMVTMKPKDPALTEAAFEGLGYTELQKRYGVKLINVYQQPFEQVDLGDGFAVRYNQQAVQSDVLIDLPVLKTHAQTVVSLGIKNLKGLIDVSSRKKCHSPDAEQDLHHWVARLARPMPPMLTVIDGIYSLERGPSFDGKARRSNLLIASTDVLAADMAGTMVLGHDPARVPHLAHACARQNRYPDGRDLEIRGMPISEVRACHQFEFPYNEDQTLPQPMHKMGIQGLSYYKYDATMCTFCSAVNWLVLSAIAMAWDGTPWDDVEVLTGKRMQPTPGKKTILLGKCMWEAHRDHPDIESMIPVKGCPPKPEAITKALHQAGIMVDPNVLHSLEQAPSYFLKRYKDRPEFEHSFYRVQELETPSG